MSPEAVRQAACRLRSRLRRLAADDARYASLAELPVLDVLAGIEEGTIAPDAAPDPLRRLVARPHPG